MIRQWSSSNQKVLMLPRKLFLVIFAGISSVLGIIVSMFIFQNAFLGPCHAQLPSVMWVQSQSGLSKLSACLRQGDHLMTDQELVLNWGARSELVIAKNSELVLFGYGQQAVFFELLSGGLVFNQKDNDIALLKMGFETYRIDQEKTKLEYISASINLDQLPDVTQKELSKEPKKDLAKNKKSIVKELDLSLIRIEPQSGTIVLYKQAKSMDLIIKNPTDDPVLFNYKLSEAEEIRTEYIAAGASVRLNLSIDDVKEQVQWSVLASSQDDSSEFAGKEKKIIKNNGVKGFFSVRRYSDENFKSSIRGTQPVTVLK